MQSTSDGLQRGWQLRSGRYPKHLPSARALSGGDGIPSEEVIFSRRTRYRLPGSPGIFCISVGVGRPPYQFEQSPELLIRRRALPPVHEGADDLDVA